MTAPRKCTHSPRLIVRFCGRQHGRLLSIGPGHKRRLLTRLRGRFGIAMVARGISGLRRQTKDARIVRLRNRLAGMYSDHSPGGPRCVGRLGPRRCRVHVKSYTQSNSRLHPFVI